MASPPVDKLSIVAPRKNTGKANELFAQQCRNTLEQFWDEVRGRVESGDMTDYLDDELLRRVIRESLADSTDKTYHYVLITQLISKGHEPETEYAFPSGESRCTRFVRSPRYLQEDDSSLRKTASGGRFGAFSRSVREQPRQSAFAYEG